MIRVLTTTFLCAPLTVAAQTWRTVDAARQLRDSSAALSVRVEYGAGRVDLRPSASMSLYEMELRYDAERSEPVTKFDAVAHTLVLGVRSLGMKIGGSNNEAGSFRAALSTRVPMDLSLALGAVQGEVDLSGMRLRDLALKAGAADLAVHFASANPERMRLMTLDVGAASLTVTGAAFARTERVRANIAAGALDLDLSGALDHDVDVSVNMAMGHCTLRVARDAAVRIDASTLLGDFDKAGLEKRSDGWYSPGFDQATHHVRVQLRAFVGGFTLSRGAP